MAHLLPGGHRPGALASVQFCSQHENLSLVALRLSGAPAMWGQQTPSASPWQSLQYCVATGDGLCVVFSSREPVLHHGVGSTGQTTGSLELGIRAGFLVTILASVSCTLSSASPVAQSSLEWEELQVTPVGAHPGAHMRPKPALLHAKGTAANTVHCGSEPGDFAHQ